MKEDQKPHSGVSEVVGTILIIILVIALVAIFIGIFTGMINLTGKTAYIVPKAEAKEISLTGGTARVILLSNLGGDITSLNTSVNRAAYELGIYVDTPSASYRVKQSPGLQNFLFAPGEMIYVFRDQNVYYTSDNLSDVPAGSTIPAGDLSLRLVDETNHVLVTTLPVSGSGVPPPPTTSPTTPVTTTATTAPPTSPITTATTSPTTTVTTPATTSVTTTATTSPTTTVTTPATTSVTTTATTSPTTTTTTAKRSISGIKWLDTNGNGRRDGSETGLSGWTIRLLRSNSPGGPYTLYMTTTTGSGGSYSFNNVDNGKYYQVREDLPPGWIQTYPQGGYYTDLHITDSSFTGRDFGNRQY